MSGELVRLTIDGREAMVPRGTTILQAAESLGIYIPRYCYHPALRIVGSCRICQVEVIGNPTPQISCFTQVAEGMDVLTDSPLVKRVRTAVMEFLLLNHPIDCPICDTSGECDLQNFYMTDGKHRSRLRHHKINRTKRKRIGQNVVLDQERCILCSRCVRFLQEVVQTHELGLFGRGAPERIDLVEGKSLDGNNYAGNIIDLCPVGALTDDDFRFKFRVWDLSRAPSICPFCSAGCNIEVHFNTELCWKNNAMRIGRVKPRLNPHVNSYWMCDIGRYSFHYTEHPDRLKQPLVREGEQQTAHSWSAALALAAAKLKQAVAGGTGRLAAFPSLYMTVESAFLFRRLFSDQFNTARMGFQSGIGLTGGDGFLLRDDRNPNRLGLELVKMDRKGGEPRDELLERLPQSKFSAVVYVQELPERDPPAELAAALRGATAALIVFATNATQFTALADIVFPICPWTEDHGTWVNWQGRAQWLTPALPPMGGAKPLAAALAGLAPFFGLNFGQGAPDELFDRMANEVPAFKGLTLPRLGGEGAGLPGFPASRLTTLTETKER